MSLQSVPLSGTWPVFVEPYTRNRAVFLCPSHSLDSRPCGPSCQPYGADWPNTNYGFLSCFYAIPWVWGNPSVISLGMIQHPSGVVMVFDSSKVMGCVVGVPWANACGAWCTPSLQKESNCRHNGGSNLAFVDGHVKWLRHEYIRAEYSALGWHGPPW
jgi:prepilin-type processing-associated H-X9-DG protein